VVRGHPSLSAMSPFDRAYTIKPSTGPKSLYFATPLAFNASDGGVPWDDLRKILYGGHRVPRYTVVKKYCRKLQPPE